jgi:lipoate---protein ligase
MSGWSVEHVTGTAGDLHRRDVDWTRRSVRIHHVTRPAIVLGSTQAADDLLDPDAVSRSAAEVVVRRSGGGVVVLCPGEHVWLDVVVPRGDPLWDDDVTRAGWWLGESWARTLADHLPDPAASVGVHRGGVSDAALGRVACFAALGPGGVEVGGRKVVGLSQRRTRAGARFQCTAMTTWDPFVTLDVLRPEVRSAALVDALTARVAAVAPWWGDVGGLVAELIDGVA